MAFVTARNPQMYPGFSYAIVHVNADVINRDLLEFIQADRRCLASTTR